MYKRRFSFISPIMILLYIIIAILLIIYFGFAFFFHTHYLPNTTIGNSPYGFQTAEYVEKENTEQISYYSILIHDRKGKLLVIEGKNFDYTYVYQGEEKEILESQNPFAWPLALFKSKDYTLSYSVEYDEEKLQKAINNLVIFNEDYMEQPVDAYIQLNESGYTIVPEVNGNVPIAEQVSKEILEAVRNGETSVTLSSACYVTPARHSSSPEILEAASTIDKYLNSTITYQIEGSEEAFTKEHIMSAIRLDADYQVTFDTAVIDKYVQHLASTYNTYGDTREFVTSKGDTIKIGGGDYGWVIAKKKETAQILQDLSGGVPVSREPIYEQTAAQSGLYDIGDTYVEVDYTNQHLWFYKEGELVLESDFVSGSMSEGNGSPDGVFKIVYKQRDATLRGEDYESAVSYFMPFAYNVGFHDASWRKKFGGDIYMDDGSHGCINMPVALAKELYEKVSTDTPVIAFYREPVELSSYNCQISNAYSYVEPADEPEETPATPTN